MEDSERDKAKAERVTKLDAARRQIRVAIRLFFQREDMAAVHTLAAAAQEVLREIGKARSVETFARYDDAVDQIVRPEMREEFCRMLRQAQNFLKHADRDPDGVLDFYPEATQYYLFDATRMYILLDPVGSPEALMFLCWFSVKHPYLLKRNGAKTELEQEFEQALAKGFADVDDFETILEALDAFVRGQPRPMKRR